VRNNPVNYVDPSGFAEIGITVLPPTIVTAPRPSFDFDTPLDPEDLAEDTGTRPPVGSALGSYSGDPLRSGGGSGFSFQSANGATAVSSGAPTQTNLTTTTTTSGGTTSTTTTVTQCTGACGPTSPPPTTQLGPTLSSGSSGAAVSAPSPNSESPVNGGLLIACSKCSDLFGTSDASRTLGFPLLDGRPIGQLVLGGVKAFADMVYDIYNWLTFNEAAKPAGIPDNWIEGPTDGEGGRQWVNPDNSGDRVRSMPGNPNSPNPAQQGSLCSRYPQREHVVGRKWQSY
jgi:hypothetical protein